MGVTEAMAFWYYCPTNGTVSCLVNCTSCPPDHTPDKPHKGLDIFNISRPIVVAAFGGTIRHRDWLAYGYGNTVEIEHVRFWGGVPHVRWTRYAHLSSFDGCPGLDKGVSSNQQIGVMGNTGGNYGVHLHWEVRDGQSHSAFWYPIELSTGQNVSRGQQVWVYDSGTLKTDPVEPYPIEP